VINDDRVNSWFRLEETNWSGAGNSILKKNNIPNTSLKKTIGKKGGATIEESEAAAVVPVTDWTLLLLWKQVVQQTLLTLHPARQNPDSSRAFFISECQIGSRWTRKCY
jgi:hypothetical protein